MRCTLEHRRMRPVLELARRLDIANNLDPQAIFEAGTGGFQIWCTPEDHPRGWDGVKMVRGAFSKPCEYVASVCWGWEGENIACLLLSTDGYALHDRDLEAGITQSYIAYSNRPGDLAWARKKVRWLFRQAGVSLPRIVVSGEWAGLARIE